MKTCKKEELPKGVKVNRTAIIIILLVMLLTLNLIYSPSFDWVLNILISSPSFVYLKYIILISSSIILGGIYFYNKKKLSKTLIIEYIKKMDFGLKLFVVAVIADLLFILFRNFDFIM